MDEKSDYPPGLGFYPVNLKGSLGRDLTKRELFAAMAMQGYNANPELGQRTEREKVKWSIEDADALLAAVEADNG